MSDRNVRRVSVLLSSQTLYHLENMRSFCGYKDIGHVIDKLVREKRMSMNTEVYNGDKTKHKARGRNR